MILPLIKEVEIKQLSLIGKLSVVVNVRRQPLILTLLCILRLIHGEKHRYFISLSCELLGSFFKSFYTAPVCML